MNIYLLKHQVGYQTLTFYDTLNIYPFGTDQERDTSMRFGRIRGNLGRKISHAKPVLHEWDPNEWPRIVLLKGYDEIIRGDILPADYPSFGGTLPAFSKNAVNLLRDILEDSGEILPINCDDGTYFLYNVTWISHAFDLEKSKTNERNTWIYKYAFFKDIIADEDQEEKLFIFRLSNIKTPSPLVTDSFIQRVNECGLTGFDFEKVWSSEEEN